MPFHLFNKSQTNSKVKKYSFFHHKMSHSIYDKVDIVQKSISENISLEQVNKSKHKHIKNTNETIEYFNIFNGFHIGIYINWTKTKEKLSRNSRIKIQNFKFVGEA